MTQKREHWDLLGKSVRLKGQEMIHSYNEVFQFQKK